MKSGEEFKNAFQTHFGQFEFCMMAFSLTGAPGSFQDAMNMTLASYLRRFVLVFFDDILIYNPTWESHLVHIRLVLELLARDQWKLKLSECSFAQEKISYLGHVISAAGVSTDLAKLEAIAQWSAPASVKELRGFLGLAGYYRKFVCHFGIISKPLTNLLKKNALFIWTTDHETVFQTLKKALCQPPVLALPNFNRPSVLKWMHQTRESGQFSCRMAILWHTLVKLLVLNPVGCLRMKIMAILLAVQSWRSYL